MYAPAVVAPVSAPSKSALDSIPYGSTFHGKSMADWVQQVHRALSEQSGWEFRPLAPGAYGYDNMVLSLEQVFKLPDLRFQPLAAVAEAVHTGWCRNYIYWRDQQPWLADAAYRKPFNPLRDERRDACASAPYTDLPSDEQKKDLVIAECILLYVC